MERPFGAEDPAMQQRVEAAMPRWRALFERMAAEILKRQKLS